MVDVNITQAATLNFKIPEYPEPGSIRYIVFTVLANLNSRIDLLRLSQELLLEKDGIESIKYIKKKEGISIFRSFDENGVNSNKAFNNQATIVLHTSDGKPINTKVFQNGKLQMTGCRYLKDSTEISEKILTIFKTLSDDIIPNVAKLKVNDTSIAMINSIFFTHFELKRRELVDILNTEYSSELLSCNFEVNNYQGVNIKKTSKNKNTVTILVFRSGKTLITGGKCQADIIEMYKFINSIFKKHYQQVALIQFDPRFLN